MIQDAFSSPRPHGQVYFHLFSEDSRLIAAEIDMTFSSYALISMVFGRPGLGDLLPLELSEYFTVPPATHA